MESIGSRDRKIPSTDRILSAYSANTSQNDAAEDFEFDEDDIFSTDVSPNAASSDNDRDHCSSSVTVSLTPHSSTESNLQRESFKTEGSGILAVLTDKKIDSQRYLYVKTPPVSSSSSSKSSSSAVSAESSTSSARVIPKPPQERVPVPISSSKYQRHSAPVNVPTLTEAMRRRKHEFDEIDEVEEEINGKKLLPHEIAAKTQSLMTACSVLEGVGRTLKGRDLRQVRNAVWRQTGFLD